MTGKKGLQRGEAEQVVNEGTPKKPSGLLPGNASTEMTGKEKQHRNGGQR